MIDIAMAGTAIMPQWASNTGRATDTYISTTGFRYVLTTLPLCDLYCSGKRRAHTNTHHNQEPGTESPKIHHCTPGTLHEVIGIRTSSTYPIRQGSNHVGRYDEQGQVAVEEGGGENDEEEAYGEDLVGGGFAVSWIIVVGAWVWE